MAVYAPVIPRSQRTREGDRRLLFDARATARFTRFFAPALECVRRGPTARPL